MREVNELISKWFSTLAAHCKCSITWSIFYIYLAVPGLSCRMRYLWFSLWSLVVACKVLLVACGIHSQGWNPGLLHWKHGVPAAGPLGKSPSSLVIIVIWYQCWELARQGHHYGSWHWNLPSNLFQRSDYFCLFVSSSTLTNILYSVHYLKKNVYIIYLNLTCFTVGGVFYRLLAVWLFF